MDPINWKPLNDRTWKLITAVHGERFHRDASCFLWAAAVAEALKPHGGLMRAGGAMLPGQVIATWGIMINPAQKSFYLTCDAEVDPVDGSYNGHCWVAIPGGWDPLVVDVMSGYRGPAQVGDASVIYEPKPSLLASIKRYYKAEIDAVRKAVRKDTKYVALIGKLVADAKPAKAER